MKKITFFALLVLAGMIFVAPALKAQEAPAADDAQVQEAAPAADADADADAEAAKKAKAITMVEDEDQTGNFLSNFDWEALGGFFGIDFDNDNPVITTSHTEKDEEGDEPGPVPPQSKSSLY